MKTFAVLSVYLACAALATWYFIALFRRNRKPKYKEPEPADPRTTESSQIVAAQRNEIKSVKDPRVMAEYQRQRTEEYHRQKADNYRRALKQDRLQKSHSMNKNSSDRDDPVRWASIQNPSEPYSWPITDYSSSNDYSSDSSGSSDSSLDFGGGDFGGGGAGSDY